MFPTYVSKLVITNFSRRPLKLNLIKKTMKMFHQQFENSWKEQNLINHAQHNHVIQFQNNENSIENLVVVWVSDDSYDMSHTYDS